MHPVPARLPVSPTIGGTGRSRPLPCSAAIVPLRGLPVTPWHRPYARQEQANMRSALLMGRELLRCRLAKGNHDALLGRVAERLDAACEGAAPFCILPTSRTPPGVRACPRYVCSPFRRESRGSHGGGQAHDAAYPTQDAFPQSAAGVGGPSRSRIKGPPLGWRELAPRMVGSRAEGLGGWL